MANKGNNAPKGHQLNKVRPIKWRLKPDAEVDLPSFVASFTDA